MGGGSFKTEPRHITFQFSEKPLAGCASWLLLPFTAADGFSLCRCAAPEAIIGPAFTRDGRCRKCSCGSFKKSRFFLLAPAAQTAPCI